MKGPGQQLGIVAVTLVGAVAVCRVGSCSRLLFLLKSKGKGRNNQFGVGISIEIATQGIFAYLARTRE